MMRITTGKIIRNFASFDCWLQYSSETRLDKPNTGVLLVIWKHFNNGIQQIKCLFSFQLHSEYRSTYRWHEYTPKQAGTVVRTAPIPQQPLSSSGTLSSYKFQSHPHLISDGSEFSRGRKKAPDVAYKCHEFFEARGGARGDMDHVDTRVTRVSVDTWSDTCVGVFGVKCC